MIFLFYFILLSIFFIWYNLKMKIKDSILKLLGNELFDWILWQKLNSNSNLLKKNEIRQLVLYLNYFFDNIQHQSIAIVLEKKNKSKIQWSYNNYFILINIWLFYTIFIEIVALSHIFVFFGLFFLSLLYCLIIILFYYIFFQLHFPHYCVSLFFISIDIYLSFVNCLQYSMLFCRYLRCVNFL